MPRKQITIAAYLAGATTLAVSLPVMAASETSALQSECGVVAEQSLSAEDLARLMDVKGHKIQG